MNSSEMAPEIELHPLQPFIPADARILLLGSFPPPLKRWSMDFFYPNLQNDMWRIMGLLFYGNRDHFVEGKRFDYDAVVRFCTEQQIAIYDTASAVRRLKSNASDAFLEIVEQTDIHALLSQMPQCRIIAATGGKSAEVIAQTFHTEIPAVGEFVEIHPSPDRPSPRSYRMPFGTVELGSAALQPSLRFYRMPSSSRAYPLSLDKKADAYKKLFA